MATAVREKPATASKPVSCPLLSPQQAISADSSAPVQPGAPSLARRNLLVILHGKRVDDDLLRKALQEIKDQGNEVSVRVTFDRGDVEHFISEAIHLNDVGTTNYQTIVAGGGDGTLNEVAGALMKHREAVARQGLAIALIPLGTANDFACTAGISVDPREALQLALDSSLIRPIDVALCNGQLFLNVSVAGGLAEVPADELSSKWKRLLGPVAIAFYVLKRLTSKRVLQPHAGASISFNPHPARSMPQHSKAQAANSSSGSAQGQQQQSQKEGHDKGGQEGSDSMLQFQTDMLMLVAGNSRQMGRTVAVCPDALLDDGLLDFTLLTGSSLATQAAALVSALASRDDHDSALDSGICQLRASRLEVLAAGGGGSSEDAIPVNRDGEPEPASHRLVFEVLHKALPMHLPDERLLVSGQAAQRGTAQHTVSGSITGSIKHPDNGTFIPASTAVPAAGEAGHAAAATAGTGQRRGSRHRRGRKGLTVRALRRMLVVSGPVGLGVRRKAALLAVARGLATSMAVMLVGGVLGWAVGARASQGQQQPEQQQKKPAQQQQQQQVVEQGAAAVSRKSRREQRRQEGRRQSQQVAAAAEV